MCNNVLSEIKYEILFDIRTFTKPQKHYNIWIFAFEDRINICFQSLVADVFSCMCILNALKRRYNFGISGLLLTPVLNETHSFDMHNKLLLVTFLVNHTNGKMIKGNAFLIRITCVKWKVSSNNLRLYATFISFWKLAAYFNLNASNRTTCYLNVFIHFSRRLSFNQIHGITVETLNNIFA